MLRGVKIPINVDPYVLLEEIYSRFHNGPSYFHSSLFDLLKISKLAKNKDVIHTLIEGEYAQVRAALAAGQQILFENAFTSSFKEEGCSEVSEVERNLFSGSLYFKYTADELSAKQEFLKLISPRLKVHSDCQIDTQPGFKEVAKF